MTDSKKTPATDEKEHVPGETPAAKLSEDTVDPSSDSNEETHNDTQTLETTEVETKAVETKAVNTTDLDTTALDTKKTSSSDAEEVLENEPQKIEDTKVSASDTAPPSTSTDTKKTQKGKSQPKDKPSQRKGPGWIAYSIIFIFLCAILGAMYMGLQYSQKAKKNFEGEIAALRAELDEKLLATQKTNDGKISQIKQQVGQSSQSVTQTLKQLKTTAQQTQTQALAKVNELNKRVDGHQKRLVSLSTTSKEDWLLAEAEYLLKLANQRVLLEKTPINALALLSEADNIIYQVSSGMGNRELFAIRNAIAEELVALRAVKPIDQEGIYLQLAAIANGIEKINTIGEFSPSESTSPAESKSEDESAESNNTEADQGIFERFRSELSDTVALFFNKYVRIEDQDIPVLTQKSHHLIHLNLRMLLEQAQLALLKQDQRLYQHSLTQAHKLIQQYYTPEAIEYRYTKEIAALKELNVAPELPDISTSLSLLHSFIEELHRLNPKSPSKQMQVKGG